ncbi:hypothetical protein ACFL2C_03660 [Patescibacteria group bacterium]
MAETESSSQIVTEEVYLQFAKTIEKARLLKEQGGHKFRRDLSDAEQVSDSDRNTETCRAGDSSPQEYGYTYKTGDNKSMEVTFVGFQKPDGTLVTTESGSPLMILKEAWALRLPSTQHAVGVGGLQRYVVPRFDKNGDMVGDKVLAIMQPSPHFK